MPSYIAAETNGYILQEDGASKVQLQTEVFTTPILDDFNRANESPLSNGGKWTFASGNGAQPLALAGNLCAGPPGSSNASSYWNVGPITGDFEMCCTIVGVAAGNLSMIELQFASNPTAAYPNVKLYTEINSNGTWNVMRIYMNVVPPLLVTVPSAPIAMGVDRLGFRRIGSMLEFWHYTAAIGWRRLGATSEDAAVVNPGYLRILLQGQASGTQNVKIDDFGGGSLINAQGGLTEMGVTGLNDTLATRAYPEPKTNTVTKPRPVAGQIWPRRK